MPRMVIQEIQDLRRSETPNAHHDENEYHDDRCSSGENWEEGDHL